MGGSGRSSFTSLQSTVNRGSVSSRPFFNDSTSHSTLLTFIPSNLSSPTSSTHSSQSFGLMSLEAMM